MRMKAVRMSVGLLGVLAAVLLVRPTHSDTQAAPIPDETFMLMVKTDLEYLSKWLGDSKAKDAKKTLKALAAYLALAGQNQGSKLLRDEALKMADAIGKNDFKTAKEVADKLASAKLSTGEKLDALKWTGKAAPDLAEVMDPFRKAGPKGGLGMEKDIRDGKKSVKELNKIVLAAQRSALIAEITMNLEPDGGFGGKKSKADWEKHTKDMQQYALEVVELAKDAKKNEAKLKATLGKLDASCVGCHNVFRE